MGDSYAIICAIAVIMKLKKSAFQLKLILEYLILTNQIPFS